MNVNQILLLLHSTMRVSVCLICVSDRLLQKEREKERERESRRDLFEEMAVLSQKISRGLDPRAVRLAASRSLVVEGVGRYRRLLRHGIG